MEAPFVELLSRVAGELPIIKARAKVDSHRLVLACTFVTPKAIISESEFAGQFPTLTAVLQQKGTNAILSIASSLADHFFKIVKCNSSKHRLPQFGRLVLID